MKPFSITLRGKTYTAPDPTSRELRQLACIFFKGETDKERIESLLSTMQGKNPFEFDLNDPEDFQRATLTLIVRMDSPIVQATLAHTLRSLFPDLPETLINHRLIYISDNEREARVTWKVDDNEGVAIVLEAWKYMQAEQEAQQAEALEVMATEAAIAQTILEDQSAQPAEPLGFDKPTKGRKGSVKVKVAQI